MDSRNLEHRDLVRALVKPQHEILSDATPNDMGLIHMIMGVSGETGELLDAIKKHVIYKKPLDIENIIEELGDIEFYLEGLRQCLNISRISCLEKNIEKLNKRYASGSYSNEQAIIRADKAPDMS